MNTLVYCIEHEEMVLAEETPLGVGHGLVVPTYDYPPFESEFCEFPKGLAYCPPPELDMDDFMEWVEEPSSSFLFLSDNAGRELEAEVA